MTDETPAPSLGPAVLDWMLEHLVFGPGPLHGQPLTLTVEAQAFVCRLLEIELLAGGELGKWGVGARWRWRRAHLERIKEWGKSPLAGGLSLACLAGPWRFDGLDAHGQPVGVPVRDPKVALMAIAEEQTEFVYEPAMVMAREGALAARFDVTNDRIRLVDAPGVIQPFTARAKSKFGGGADLAILDQTESWTSPEHHHLAKEATRQVAKRGGIRLDLANAGEPGAGSVGELARKPSDRALIDVLAASGRHDLHTRDGRRRALLEARGMSEWIDVEGLLDDAQDTTVDLAEWIRWYTGRWVPSANQVATPERWRDVIERTGQPLSAGDEIALGFDGSKLWDATALVAVRLEDSRAALLNLWERPEGAAGEGWEVDDEAVDQVVQAAFRTYRVVMFGYDPPYWEEAGRRWERRWGVYPEGPLFKVWTKTPSVMGPAIDEVVTEIRAGSFTADPDERLRRHVGNARLGKDRGYTTVVKAGRGRFIDAFVATVIARAARNVGVVKPPKGYGKKDTPARLVRY